MNIKFKVLGMVLLTASIFSSAQATTNQELELIDVAETASVIVTGEVIKRDVSLEDGKPKTIVSVRITDQIKGNTSDVITVVVPGGSYSTNGFRVGETYAGVPPVFLNQQNLYFLTATQTADQYQIVGFNQGVMAIESDGEAEVVKGTLTHGKAMPMHEMKSKINRMKGQ